MATTPSPAFPSTNRPARAIVLAAALAGLLALPTAAAVRLGTPGNEKLVGTPGADKITGDEGNDRLNGLAGNDTYYFADGWGQDILVEKKGAGVDTLSFAGLSGDVEGDLVAEWRGVDPGVNRLRGGPGESIDLGVSRVENVTGSPGEDRISGGGGANRYDTGGGNFELFQDFGGFKAGANGFPGLAESDDVYLGAAANTGQVTIVDFGGEADLLDLRPLRSDQVYLAKFDCDGTTAAPACLQIVTGTGEGSVLILGHFGPFPGFAELGQEGRIETIRFADGPVTFAAPDKAKGKGNGMGKGKQAAGKDGNALLGKATTPRQKELAAQAPDLTRDAARHIPDSAEIAGQPIEANRDRARADGTGKRSGKGNHAAGRGTNGGGPAADAGAKGNDRPTDSGNRQDNDKDKDNDKDQGKTKPKGDRDGKKSNGDRDRGRDRDRESGRAGDHRERTRGGDRPGRR